MISILMLLSRMCSSVELSKRALPIVLLLTRFVRRKLIEALGSCVSGRIAHSSFCDIFHMAGRSGGANESA